jgi:hypothetical protein
LYAGLHAFPFHVLSVVLHALVSLLVLALAQHLFAKLESAAGWASSYAASSSSELAAATAGGVYGGTGSSSSIMLGRLLMWQHQPELWLRPGTWAGQAQALIAAVLFALHPAHTEVRKVTASSQHQLQQQAVNLPEPCINAHAVDAAMVLLCTYWARSSCMCTVLRRFADAADW